MSKIKKLMCLMTGTVFLCNAIKEPVTLPSAEFLKEALQHKNFHDLLEKTNIAARLANKQKFPLEIVTEIERILRDYPNYATVRKSELIKCILQQNPETIKDLQNFGLIN